MRFAFRGSRLGEAGAVDAACTTVCVRCGVPDGVRTSPYATAQTQKTQTQTAGTPRTLPFETARRSRPDSIDSKLERRAQTDAQKRTSTRTYVRTAAVRAPLPPRCSLAARCAMPARPVSRWRAGGPRWSGACAGVRGAARAAVCAACCFLRAVCGGRCAEDGGRCAEDGGRVRLWGLRSSRADGEQDGGRTPFISVGGGGTLCGCGMQGRGQRPDQRNQNIEHRTANKE